MLTVMTGPAASSVVDGPAAPSFVDDDAHVLCEADLLPPNFLSSPSPASSLVLGLPSPQSPAIAAPTSTYATRPIPSMVGRRHSVAFHSATPDLVHMRPLAEGTPSSGSYPLAPSFMAQPVPSSQYGGPSMSRSHSLSHDHPAMFGYGVDHGSSPGPGMSYPRFGPAGSRGPVSTQPFVATARAGSSGLLGEPDADRSMNPDVSSLMALHPSLSPAGASALVTQMQQQQLQQQYMLAMAAGQLAAQVGAPPALFAQMGMQALPKKISLYKTELCRTFEETGFCRYGAKCQFAHDKSELRIVPRHPRYKTEICRTFWELGNCPYGKRCCFIHLEAGPTMNGQLPGQWTGGSAAGLPVGIVPVASSSVPVAPTPSTSAGGLAQSRLSVSPADGSASGAPSLAASPPPAATFDESLLLRRDLPFFSEEFPALQACGKDSLGQRSGPSARAPLSMSPQGSLSLDDLLAGPGGSSMLFGEDPYGGRSGLAAEQQPALSTVSSATSLSRSSSFSTGTSRPLVSRLFPSHRQEAEGAEDVHSPLESSSVAPHGTFRASGAPASSGTLGMRRKASMPILPVQSQSSALHLTEVGFSRLRLSQDFGPMRAENDAVAGPDCHTDDSAFDRCESKATSPDTIVFELEDSPSGRAGFVRKSHSICLSGEARPLLDRTTGCIKIVADGLDADLQTRLKKPTPIGRPVQETRACDVTEDRQDGSVPPPLFQPWSSRSVLNLDSASMSTNALSAYAAAPAVPAAAPAWRHRRGYSLSYAGQASGASVSPSHQHPKYFIPTPKRAAGAAPPGFDASGKSARPAGVTGR